MADLSHQTFQQPMMGAPYFSQSILDKIKEDCQKLKAACAQIKNNDSSVQTQQHEVVEGSPSPLSNEDQAIQKWLEEKKLLRVKTELDSIGEMEGLPLIIILRLFAILVYKNDERTNEIKQILLSFISQIEQEFVKMLGQLDCKTTCKKDFLESFEQGKSDSIILFTMLSFLFKKNIRFYYLKNQQVNSTQASSANNSAESVADTGSSGSIFNEINLVYDLSPEQVFLKFYIRGDYNGGNGQAAQRIFFDLICNEFEYEIMYRKTFTGATQGIILQDEASKHKRGNSNGMQMPSQNPMMFNNSPGHNLGLFSSPQSHQLNQLLMQQDPLSSQNSILSSPFSMQGLNTSGLSGGQSQGLYNPQALLIMQQQQEELQKLILLKQQTLLLQQQQLLMPQLGVQGGFGQFGGVQGFGGMNPQGFGGLGGNNMMPPPGLGAMGQSLPPQIHGGHFQNPQGNPLKAMHNPSNSHSQQQQQRLPHQHQYQQQQQHQLEKSLDSIEVTLEEIKNFDQQVEEHNKSRQQQQQHQQHQQQMQQMRGKTMSMDIGSKAFVPTKRGGAQSIHNAGQVFNGQPPMPGGLPNAYDIFNKPQQPLQEEPSDFRVSGRLKFFSEGQSYGFVVSDIDNSDLFFHFDDMKKTNLSKQFLKDAKNKYLVRLTFKVMAYYGKYNLSKKAVDLELVKIEPLPYQPGTTQATIDHLAGRFPGGAAAPLGLEHSFNTQLNINAAASGSNVNNSSFISNGSSAQLNSSFISNGGL